MMIVDLNSDAAFRGVWVGGIVGMILWWMFVLDNRNLFRGQNVTVTELMIGVFVMCSAGAGVGTACAVLLSVGYPVVVPFIVLYMTHRRVWFR